MDWLRENILLLVVLVPFGGALALALIPNERVGVVHWGARCLATVGLVLAGLAFILYDRGQGGFQMERQFPWLPSLGASFHVGVDGIGVALILLNGIVMFTGTLVSWNIRNRPKDFFVLFFLLGTGVYGVFASLDLFFLFFFYELAVLPMFLLIGVWGSSTDFGTFIRTKEYGALKLTLYLVAGSILVWVGLLGLWVEAGRTSFDLVVLQEVSFARTFQLVFYPMLMVGFGVLAGLWPFHTWSPDGHVAAPTAVSMLHAGVLMKLGAFGILQVGMRLLPEGAQAWAPVLIALGTVNVLYGAVSALAQQDLKYVVGYSSVSHMGYVLMGLATLDPLGINGAVLQMFSHGIMTALFFALVGVIYDRAHIRDIGVLEGLAKRMGTTASFFAVAGLTSLGLPGLSGFVAELLVFLGAFRTYPALAVLGVIGAAVTAVYILRLLGKVFFGPLGERWRDLPDASPLEVGATALLVAVLVIVGLAPFTLLDTIDVGVTEVLQRVFG
ncbi:MAG: NADH-quinone oxidoreductase subunit M [Dehalococcoidia bacterium]|nr:NADH-quinone oxidoreductase subunit M [Dehalococcoidia bacterium]MDW8119102.1 NADH-quinone oxidoreductase subunit M [Chloroflexota bacterium]